MTHLFTGGRDIAVLYGDAGTPGSTVLRYSSAPSVKVLAGSVTASYAAGSGDLRLDYTHSGLARVLVSGGGRRPLLLLLGTSAEAAAFWRAGTDANPVLVRGTSLVRSATTSRGTVSLRADTVKAGDVEVFGGARALVGERRHASRRVRPPAVRCSASLPGPQPVHLPALTGWRARTEAPEAAAGFDDSRWTAADHTTTESPLKPKTPAVLYADDYHFHYGDVWYRGHFTAHRHGDEGVAERLHRQTRLVPGLAERPVPRLRRGRRPGRLRRPGQHRSRTRRLHDPGRAAVRPGEQAVLSVLVENMGHNDDWIADDNRFKQPRGLYAVSLEGSAAPITWRIQGARGGEDLPDVTRGPLNNGGLYGERAGWHLPGYTDGSWARGAPAQVSPGVTWLRTHVRAGPADGARTCRSTSASAARSCRATGCRSSSTAGTSASTAVTIGPQTDFALPAGLLRQHGHNTLALAVVARQAASVAPVSLVAAGASRGGVPVSGVPAPSYR